MIGFINKIFNKTYYERFVKILNKHSGIPQNVMDWRVRASACEELIKELGNDNEKIEALKRIKHESEENAKQIEAQEKTKYLSQFSGNEGWDKYVQSGGRKFAKEIWFHRDKSKITVINDSCSVDYNMVGENPGNWYQHNINGVNYEITLGVKSPEQILISIDDGKEYESFIIDLVPKSPDFDNAPH
jgi:hypothetical protein